MAVKRLCVVCGRRPAEVPDRERVGRPIKRVCQECHVARLREDLARIVEEQRSGDDAV